MNTRDYTPSEFYKKILDDLNFDGRDALILLCAILIASIGLNLNSIPTVIGAMLISPLMTPIVAIGVSISLYSTKLLKKALRLLAMEILVSLAVSVLYFWLSPISYASEQLMARTSPTIWDILIAFVGGLAGLIGLQRKAANNIIPGVAIATALMPPLCTVGYAIAHQKLGYFLGASYLFLINGVFIILATVVGMYMTSLPKKMRDYQVNNRNYQLLFILALVAFSIPSLISAGQLIDSSYQRLAINQMIQKELAQVTVLNRHYDESSKTLSLVVSGQPLSADEIKTIKKNLKHYGLEQVKLELQQINSQDQDIAKLIELLEEKTDSNVEDQVNKNKQENQ